MELRNSELWGSIYRIMERNKSDYGAASIELHQSIHGFPIIDFWRTKIYILEIHMEIQKLNMLPINEASRFYYGASHIVVIYWNPWINITHESNYGSS